MKLEDMREKLEKTLGLTYAADDEMVYRIKCCGHILRIEDEDEWREAVRLLKAYHEEHRPDE
jgi:hypothetical protein